MILFEDYENYSKHNYTEVLILIVVDDTFWEAKKKADEELRMS